MVIDLPIFRFLLTNICKDPFSCQVTFVYRVKGCRPAVFEGDPSALYDVHMLFVQVLLTSRLSRVGSVQGTRKIGCRPSSLTCIGERGDWVKDSFTGACVRLQGCSSGVRDSEFGERGFWEIGPGNPIFLLSQLFFWSLMLHHRQIFRCPCREVHSYQCRLWGVPSPSSPPRSTEVVTR